MARILKNSQTRAELTAFSKRILKASILTHFYFSPALFCTRNRTRYIARQNTTTTTGNKSILDMYGDNIAYAHWQVPEQIPFHCDVKHFSLFFSFVFRHRRRSPTTAIARWHGSLTHTQFLLHFCIWQNHFTNAHDRSLYIADLFDCCQLHRAHIFHPPVALRNF